MCVCGVFAMNCDGLGSGCDAVKSDTNGARAFPVAALASDAELLTVSISVHMSRKI